jgi:hypothetical protein
MFIFSEILVTRFKQRYHEQYIDAVFKLHSVIQSIGKMPDGSPPPTLFQSFYHLRRLFPNGFVAAQDFIGEVGTTLLLRVFALGIAVANQTIYEQRNYNLEWYGCSLRFLSPSDLTQNICRQEMCGIPDSYVDAFETAGLYALNGDGFDLSENRSIYLNWMGHLGYHAEFLHFRTNQIYLRSSADLIAFVHAQAFSLPQNCRRKHIHPIHLPFLETLSIMLCWDTGVTPLPVQAIQFVDAESPSHIPRSRILRPTAADVLAVVAEECTSRLLYPLSSGTTLSYDDDCSFTTRLGRSSMTGDC